MTKKEIAKKYDVHERTVFKWQEAGIDVNDDDAIKDHLRDIHGTDSDDLKEQKLKAEIRLKLSQAEKAELLLEEVKGNLISIPDLEENFLFIASRIKSQLSRLERELPPQLEGKTGKEMIPLIREKIDSVLQFLNDEMGGFDESPSISEIREETD